MRVTDSQVFEAGVLLDAMTDFALCGVGSGGDITAWNASGERLLGYNADEIVGQRYATLFTADEREAGEPEAHLKQALLTGRHESMGRRVRRGGTLFDAHTTVVAHPRGDARGRFAVLIRDVTGWKRLEQNLRRRAEQSEHANRTKDQMIATLAHELRTPLNAVLGWACAAGNWTRRRSDGRSRSSNATHGPGLGLSIARHLTDLHGGRLEVRSAGSGQGTTVRCHLPLR